VKKVEPQFAVQFTLADDVIGAKTDPQIKSAMKDQFARYGPIDEVRVRHDKEKKKNS